jgi:hypothetical protein
MVPGQGQAKTRARSEDHHALAVAEALEDVTLPRLEHEIGDQVRGPDEPGRRAARGKVASWS